MKKGIKEMDVLKSFLKLTKWPSRILVALWLLCSLTAEDSYEVLTTWTPTLLLSAFIIECFSNPVVKASDAKFCRFLTSTKISSRILFWMGVAVILSGISLIDQFILTFVAAFDIILLPVIIVELTSNPVMKASDYGFFRFITSTKIFSRVLFGLWVIFSILFIGMTVSGLVTVLAILTVIFLVPACIIEYKKNPFLVMFRNESAEDRAARRALEKEKRRVDRETRRALKEERKVEYKAAIRALEEERAQRKAEKQAIKEKERARRQAEKKAIEEERARCEAESRALENSQQRKPEMVKYDPVAPAKIYAELLEDKIEEPDKTDISYVDGMGGHEFEYFCADLLRAHGFVNVSVTQATGDQGVDVLAEKEGVKYAVQCKKYSSPLSNTPVQEVNAGKMFYHCHVGVVMTNSTFTPGAKSLAEATGVLLWDREVVQDMMR